MKVFSSPDAQAFVKTGSKEFRYNRDIRLTPSAKDVLIEAGIKVVFDAGAASSAAPAAPAAQAQAPAAAPVKTASGTTASSSEVLALFNSPQAQEMKKLICDIGHRCWQRDYNDGNGGNISARIGDYYLCTPTGVSKGFMKPEMVCMVDADGNQVAGNAPYRRTSEINSHLGIYRRVPAAASVCHAHPIHATAFAMAGNEPPSNLIPEVEVFVGTIPLAEYKTPGSPELSDTIGKLAPKHQAILMGNHGVITWGTSIEDAYFKMEITDSYCRTLWVASQLPTKRTTIPKDEMKILLDMKKKLGLPDERLTNGEIKLPESDPWEFISDRPIACATPARCDEIPTAVTNAELEQLVKKISDEVHNSLNKK